MLQREPVSALRGSAEHCRLSAHGPDKCHVPRRCRCWQNLGAYSGAADDLAATDCSETGALGLPRLDAAFGVRLLGAVPARCRLVRMDCDDADALGRVGAVFG